MSFHVPNGNRLRTHPGLGTEDSAGNNGAFLLGCPLPKGQYSHGKNSKQRWNLFIIASDGYGWEHVSVHCLKVGTLDNNFENKRIPSWTEMCFVKDLFWDETDVVIQYHPARAEHINNHPFTLHLWRPIGENLPCPESHLVGPRFNITPNSLIKRK